MSAPAKPPPEFAAEWMARWREAGPVLQEIRDRELAELSPEAAIQAAEVAFATPAPETPGRVEGSGLIEQQAWFMRLALLRAHGRR